VKKNYNGPQLISELEEKQKMIETERHNMELTGDSMDLKPITTRKLRRRANEPTSKSLQSQKNSGQSWPLDNSPDLNSPIL
jgi:hypothetical protein